MSEPSLSIDTTSLRPPSISTRASPSTSLTTFPNAFADQPEPGLIPSLLSKVKLTFAGSSGTPSAPPSPLPPIWNGDKASLSSIPEHITSGLTNPGQTEAQLLAAAVKERVASGKHTVPPPITIPATTGSPSARVRASPTTAQPPSVLSPSKASATQRGSKKVGSVSSSSARTPSVGQSKNRLILPTERQWKPAGIAPAQVTVSAVTSISTSGQSSAQNAEAGPSNHSKPPRTNWGFPSAPYPPPSQSPNLRRHAHRDSLTGLRPRRASFATIPDSPSSVSLSAMIHNAELNQNVSYVPGFPMQQDDTKSVRSLGLAKKQNSVSRIIRRMRGEGLSKHYWMADEHCKECYDCKSVFTAWRRKHHCRICGQIFCSRCASNIIGARRFGQDGAVRVCNLCLIIMEEYKDDDDDDRRSINSVATSARLPSISDRAFLDPTFSPETPYTKSPFAASQLFSTNPDDGLGAIEEGVPSRWESTTAGELDGGESPEVSDDDNDDGRIWTMRPNTAVPFRRMVDEDHGGDTTADSALASAIASAVATPNGSRPPSLIETSPLRKVDHDQAGSKTDTANTSLNTSPPKDQVRKKVEFPRTETISSDGGELRVPLSRMDSNQPLIGLRTRLSSRTSQGGLTALLDEKSEGLWRARSNSFTGLKPEALVASSLVHFDVMLDQALERAGIPNSQEWHSSLSRVLLKACTSVNPNIRLGDSMDIRTYIKIKKVPGGKISDCEYVDGMVISKNVAHKAMARRLVNPRIMVLTFPLDYHRVEHQFMSLDPIMAQEKDYLRLLTRRIIDVRPHIVLVERSASRLALDHLLEANIAVARSVKPSAIHQVARCTQADIVASMDRLALEPKLGRCSEFRIQSFDHDLIPGRKKTLMRFEGCHREFGCTIILRGADITTLRKIKVITRFMAMVAYQLKNEIVLYSDEHNILPVNPSLPEEYQQLLSLLTDKKQETPHVKAAKVRSAESPTTPTAQNTGKLNSETDPEKDMEALAMTRDIAVSLQPYLVTALSASASIRFPPPAPLAKMAHIDRTLTELRHTRDEEVASEILQQEKKEGPSTVSSATSTTVSTATSIAETATLSNLTDIPSSTAMSAPANLGAVRARDPYRVLRKPEEVSRESALMQAESEHAEQMRIWNWYNRRHIGPIIPEDLQNIHYLYSLGCEGNDKPCVEPKSESIDFNGEKDQTVGQFLENLALNAGQLCSDKTCDKLLLFHFQLLVHAQRRLQIAMDQFPCPSPGHEDKIITWSYCRICATPSPTTIMRDETWKMSWGAYLEHCFYPPETSAGFVCPHDAFRDQIRYFAHRNLAIRIHNESIELYDPVRPGIELRTKAETKALLKNQEYESALQKNAAFFDSVLFRLRSFDYDICQPEKVTSLKTALEAMLSRAVADREEMVNLLNQTYKLTPMTDVLALTVVLRALQDKVVQWDNDFVDIEKTFVPSEKDLRRMTANHLKRLFANQEGYGTLDRNLAGMTVSESDEKDLKNEEESASADILDTQGEQEKPKQPPSEPGSFSDLISSQPPNDADVTPMAGVIGPPLRDPMSLPPSSERDSDSDSTIGAPSRKPHLLPSFGPETSEADSDAYFVSRLPRRSKPAPSIADLVKRFQESSAQLERQSPSPPPDRPQSSNSFRRHRYHDPEPSDSDVVTKARPRLRRGKTDQSVTRNRESALKLAMLSDGDKGYAHHASRPPHSRRSLLPSSDKPTARTAPPSRHSSRPTSPEPSLLAPPTSFGSAFGNSKPRISGKSGQPRTSDVALKGATTAPRSRRNLSTTPGSRVTSIARHFDRLSREAEKERQKRNSMVRNKRARPVAATKVKVQVFNNVRDAFKDEFDTDSSEADNEEDDQEDSADSADGSRSRSRSISRSPKKSPKKVPRSTTPSEEPPSTPALPIPNEGIPVAGSSNSIASASVVSDARSELSMTDRLQIDLGNFQTSAPLRSMPATPQMSMVDTADESAGPSKSHISAMSESEFSSGGERSSILKTLTGLWAFRAGDYTPLDYPLSAAEHIFADSKVIIRENEPTSIIAFTLSSKMYRDKMRCSAGTTGKKQEAFMPDNASAISVAEKPSTWDIVSLDEAIDPEDLSRGGGGSHLKYDFDSGSSTIFCRIFFAEQFATLRLACHCEDSFVESLARCVQFDASGGKSGSAFLKTKDDRFICKEISRLEMDALTKFAPAYFDYTRKAFQGQRPTVLAKIYGFFKIGYRNAVTGRAMRMNVLVMENLFYERRFSRIYDLKGSTRNRLIQATGKMNEVLLDENLMETVYKQPMYLREHSKKILRSALYNDTLFLSNLNVMDYSLVVGVDSDRHELVVGIVDYIRTFTWDKKLESWVKDSAFLGTGRGEPTIVTPKQYKARFRAAMERYYFPSVPDRWSKPDQGDDAVTEDETGL